MQSFTQICSACTCQVLNLILAFLDARTLGPRAYGSLIPRRAVTGSIFYQKSELRAVAYLDELRYRRRAKRSLARKQERHYGRYLSNPDIALPRRFPAIGNCCIEAGHRDLEPHLRHKSQLRVLVCSGGALNGLGPSIRACQKLSYLCRRLRRFVKSMSGPPPSLRLASHCSTSPPRNTTSACIGLYASPHNPSIPCS